MVLLKFDDIIIISRSQGQIRDIQKQGSIARVITNIFSWRATGSHRQAKHFELNFFIRKTFPRLLNKAVILTAGQFAWPFMKSLIAVGTVGDFLKSELVFS